MDTREALIALNLIEGVRPVRARSLLEHFGEAPKILSASQSELMRVRNIGEDTAEKIASWEKSVDLSGELKRIADFGCHVLVSFDENYPASLREIYDPPLVLYVKGELTAKDKNAIAMVGSRMTTHYGIETARKLAYQLAYTGVTVVSGGARAVLSGAIDAGNAIATAAAPVAGASGVWARAVVPRPRQMDARSSGNAAGRAGIEGREWTSDIRRESIASDSHCIY